jgi:RHS repeat-associated protein
MNGIRNKHQGNQASQKDSFQVKSPAISIPKGGGAIRGIGEKFAANSVTGTGTMTVPIIASPSRSGVTPQLSLSYDSGSGNGPFGFGWSLSLASITRKTDKGLPRFQDAEESDVFVLSGVEDLVPVLTNQAGQWVPESVPDRTITAVTYRIKRFRPRIEGLFARIERWSNTADPSDVHWRSISKENVLSIYGKDSSSRVFDPENPSRIFGWLICETRDDKGNAVVYKYVEEDEANIDHSQVNEKNRTRAAKRYPKRVLYGNRVPLLDVNGRRPALISKQDLDNVEWLFELVFDYGDGHYEELDLNPAIADDEQHQFVLASRIAGAAWPVRPDSFSSYRSGFEIRTHRRCHRILVFHNIPDLPTGEKGYQGLVRATEINYNDLDYSQKPSIKNELSHQGSTRLASFIKSVSQSSFTKDETKADVIRNNVAYATYMKMSMPPVEFEYNKATIQEEIADLDDDSLSNLPIGLDGVTYQWVDLDGEGLSGILTEQGDAWLYKPNRGGGRFGPLRYVGKKPSLASVSSGSQQLLDLAGDGQLDLVEFNLPTPGFYERDEKESWANFRTFISRPNISWDDPNLRFVDLTGDGCADVLITEGDAFSWYESQAEEGFHRSERIQKVLDEEKGPRLVFADGTQSIYLADLSGDGLADLARVRSGEVCYWPNLGYGRFGAKVTMDNSPYFDVADQFDQQRIRLTDIDGSGTTDIIYLSKRDVSFYFNQSGNRWSAPYTLDQFPAVDNLSSVMMVDLLGNGTSCLVWSSPLPSTRRKPLRYLDLMGGKKPHLLVKMVNNLGTETHIQYASSTKFYLEDQARGRPWITKIPFPIHVIERVETYDYISRNRFVTRYAYHHGYFDGEDREFRGFGMVEQWDTEEYAALSQNTDFPSADNINQSSHIPPVLKKTWYHTGVHIGRNQVSRYFAGLLDEDDKGEYYREPGLSLSEVKDLLLEDTILPEGLTAEEGREACRTFKGSMLRQEVYALDGTDKAVHPYQVSEQNFSVSRIQPEGDNLHAVFFTYPREAINYIYERNPEDPRIQHAMTLEVDEYGEVLKEVTIGYGRRQPDMGLDAEDRLKQTQTLITYKENQLTNPVELEDHRRKPVTCEARTYQLTGYSPSGPAGRYLFSDFVIQDPSDPNGLKQQLIVDNEINYEEQSSGGKQRRIIECERTLYRPDDCGASQGNPLALLPLGMIEPLALTGENYKLAFTSGLLTQAFQRGGQSLLPNPAAVLGGHGADQGGYVDLDGDGRWWVPAGRSFYSPNKNDSAAQERTFAKDHFYVARRYRDPFEQTTTVTLDVYDLMMVETHDSLDNRMTAGERDAADTITMQGNDYRTLQPWLVMDQNRNRSQVKFDIFGRVVGTALLGKPEELLGDSLAGFNSDLTQATALSHIENPLVDPHAILNDATTRLVYDLFAYQRTKNDPKPKPTLVYKVARETHLSELEEGQKPVVQHGFTYSDGFGREIQMKALAESGPVEDGGPDIDPRWVGTGWTIYNNKGSPVRQYEPFFTATHKFEFAKIVGVSPIIFHDPSDRVLARLFPNHTYEKKVFNPWQQATWDSIDTLLQVDPRLDSDVGEFFERLPQAEYLPSWHSLRVGGSLGQAEQSAAVKAASHAGTPALTYFDSLGRSVLSIVDNGIEGSHSTRTELDIEGNPRKIVDALGRIVMRYQYDILGNVTCQESMDAGKRWILNDVAGNPIRAWDSLGRSLRNAYDQLRRPNWVYLDDGISPEKAIERIVYGEGLGEAHNHRGKIFRHFDSAGIATNEKYDFKGNPVHTNRRICADYKTIPDWSLNPTLEPAIYSTVTKYDALDRPQSQILPDLSLIKATFNEANLLETVAVKLQGEAATTAFVTDINYDAKGQRTSIHYGNGVRTDYDYDPETFRLVGLRTTRPDSFPALQRIVQDLSYTYDPAGNITGIRDAAQQTIYFNNQVVTPDTDYTYDALYRLIKAQGREHIGQQPQTQPTWNDAGRCGLAHPNDGQAMRNFTEEYSYDEVGNLLQITHQAANGNWTRDYSYNEPSLIEPGLVSNRLSDTQVGGVSDQYTYDAHGNMTSMPNLAQVAWNHKDQLQMVDLGGGGKVYYVYDATGKRVRKVHEHLGETKDERLYMGNVEIFQQSDLQGVQLSRQTLHVMDGEKRVALIETRTQGSDSAPAQLIRYQFGNRIGSACLEIDDLAQIISYEEYYPYGSTSFQSVRSQTERPKRYRYTGKERDEETGFYYHGARYYAPWIGRWTSTDPAGLVDGDNLYRYTLNNPIVLKDPSGTESGVGFTLPLGNPETDTRVHAGMFSLGTGLFGWSMEKADIGRGSLWTRYLLRSTELAGSFVILYGPMVMSHEGGHVGAIKRAGFNSYVVWSEFKWFKGASHYDGSPTPEQKSAFDAGGVNQQVFNAGAIYDQSALRGWFYPQEALGYFLGQAGTPGYALTTFWSTPPADPSQDTHDIRKYSNRSGTWSAKGIFAASLVTALPSLVGVGLSAYHLIGSNKRRVDVPGLTIGKTKLLFPHLRTLLTPQGTILGAETWLRTYGNLPHFGFSLDVLASSDPAVSVGVKAHGGHIPGLPKSLTLNPFIRATFASTCGLYGGLEARMEIFKGIGASVSISGGANDLLSIPQGIKAGVRGTGSLSFTLP